MERIFGIGTLRPGLRMLFYRLIYLGGIIVLGSIVGVTSSIDSLHMKLIEFTFLLFSIFISLHIYGSKTHMLLPYILMIWVVSPEIRRFIDWSFHSYSDTSFISLIPYCVSLTLLLPVIKNIKLIDRRTNLITKIMGVALIYGFCIGFFKYGMASVFDLLNYIVPFLVFIYVNVSNLDSDVRDKWLRSFSYLAVIVATYGIYQYLVLPPWDEFWMINADMNSIGLPEPQKFRVFSLLNSPGPTGIFLAFALAIMIVQKKWNAFGIIGVLTVAFALLLTLVRSGWIACIVLVSAYFIRSQMKNKIRLIVLVVFLFLAYVFVLPILPGASNVTSRINTFGSLEEDHSFNERLNFSSNMLSSLLTNPIGKGLGSSGLGAKLTSNTDTLAVFDNGYLNLFYTFGFPLGFAIIAIFFYLAIYLLKLSRSEKIYNPVSFAAICSALFLLSGNNILSGISGFVIWFLVSMAFIPKKPNREVL